MKIEIDFTDKFKEDFKQLDISQRKGVKKLYLEIFTLAFESENLSDFIDRLNCHNLFIPVKRQKWDTLLVKDFSLSFEMITKGPNIYVRLRVPHDVAEVWFESIIRRWG